MNFYYKCLFAFTLILLYSTSVDCNLWCYSCVSTQPGCTEHGVNWFIHSAITCPRNEDKCVKIIDRKGSDVLVTRDCLSNIVGFRRDIPADRYEGCRNAASQPKLAVYVENSVSELDLKKAYWDETTYCICEQDQWCNGQNSILFNHNFSINLIIALITAFVAHYYALT